jgi:hypothetical protein
MGEPSPVAQVSGRPVGEVLTTPELYAFGVGGGAVAGVLAVLADVGAVLPALSAGAGAIAVGVATGLAVVCVLAAASVYRDTEAVRFYRDELEAVGRSVVGERTVTVRYDDVDLAVRRSGGDVATYELLRSGKPSVVLRNVTDPETVERTLFRRVPSPQERNEEAREATDRSMAERLSDRVPMSQLGERVEAEGSADRPIGHERAFWRQWPSDRPLPDSPIVGEAAYRRVMSGQALAASDTPERGGVSDTSVRGGATATVETPRDVEELARDGRSKHEWGQLTGSSAAWFGKEKNRIEDGEHDY